MEIESYDPKAVAKQQSTTCTPVFDVQVGETRASRKKKLWLLR